MLAKIRSAVSIVDVCIAAREFYSYSATHLGVFPLFHLPCIYFFFFIIILGWNGHGNCECR